MRSIRSSSFVAAGFGTLRREITKQNCRTLCRHLLSVNFPKRHLKYTKYVYISFCSPQKKSARHIVQPLCLAISLQVAGFHRAVPSTTLDKASMQFQFILLIFPRKSTLFWRIIHISIIDFFLKSCYHKKNLSGDEVIA